MVKNICNCAIILYLLSGCSGFLAKDPEIDVSNFGFKIQGGFTEKTRCSGFIMLGFYGKASNNSQTDSLRLPSTVKFSHQLGFRPEQIRVYCDHNKDMAHQVDEPLEVVQVNYGTAEPTASISIIINLPQENSTNYEVSTYNPSTFDFGYSKAIHSRIQSLTSLDDLRFSRANVKVGLLKPLHFKNSGLSGLYIPKKYSQKKETIIFIHGIGGSPSDFIDLSKNLDSQKYQLWYYYYPSGFSLYDNSIELFNLISTAKQRYQLSKVHIVAHSMGGLVSRGYINLCIESDNCNHIKSFTSISTPWNGHNAAKMGLKFAPSVLPVWHDMVPGSPYLESLFENVLPSSIPHYLAFSIKQRDMLVFESNDGVVSIDSMLKPEAQSQARKLIGINEDHVKILSSEQLMLHFSEILP